MATLLTVTFHGLCLFAKRSDRQTDVLCHPENGDHTPTLAVRILDVDLKTNRWHPTLVGHDTKGEEIGIWDLRGQFFTLGRLENQVWHRQGNRVSLSEKHPGSQPVSETKARQVVLEGRDRGAIVIVRGGQLKYEAAPRIRIRVRHKETITGPDDFSSAISWTGSLADETGALRHPRNADGQELTLKDGGRPIALHVTNVAKEASPNGLEHFQIYYDDLVTGVEHKDRVHLLDESEMPPIDRDTNVYDCVPPTDD